MARRLAAVLAVDVVGYSRLMGEDEAATLEELKRHRRELIEPGLAAHGGRLVKATGDGFLIEFASTVAAVECALEVQRAMAARVAEQPEHRRMRFRAGLHVGDVIVEEGDLFGDAVNVAARLQAMADPGGLCLSEDAWRQVEGRVDAVFTDRGEHRLKNIARPIRVHALGGEEHAGQAVPTPVTAAPPAIAVLPFVNMSADPAQGYFSDGITEDIITELSRFRPLRVIARTSSFHFRDKALPVQEIGRALGAAYIVEGSIRRLGERIRITAQLVEAASGRHLWADRYDRAAAELFDVQDEVVRSVVYTVATRLSDAVREVARSKRPEDMGAYDCFLRGNELTGGTPEEAAEAAALFERARTLDPGFARAYTGLASLEMVRSFAPMPGPAAAAILDEAYALAERALALDPNDARVQSMMGWVCHFRRDFERARMHLDRALALNPNDPMILLAWGWLHACLGESEPAVAAVREAMRLNPVQADWYVWYLARMEFLAGRYAEALAHLDAMTDTGPRWSSWRTAALAHLGRLDEARAEAERFLAAVARNWRGEPVADPAEYCVWALDSTPLRRAEDQARLREGLRMAGLPA